jgi:hypothetical protein
MSKLHEVIRVKLMPVYAGCILLCAITEDLCMVWVVEYTTHPLQEKCLVGSQVDSGNPYWPLMWVVHRY